MLLRCCHRFLFTLQTLVKLFPLPGSQNIGDSGFGLIAIINHIDCISIITILSAHTHLATTSINSYTAHVIKICTWRIAFWNSHSTVNENINMASYIPTSTFALQRAMAGSKLQIQALNSGKQQPGCSDKSQIQISLAEVPGPIQIRNLGSAPTDWFS